MRVEAEGNVLVVKTPGEEPYELDFSDIDVGDDLRRALMSIVVARVGPTGEWGKKSAQRGLSSLRVLFEGLGVTHAGEITHAKYIERLTSLTVGSRYSHHMVLRRAIQEIPGVKDEHKSNIANHREPPHTATPNMHATTEEEFTALKGLCLDTVRAALKRVKAGWSVVEAYRNGDYPDGTPEWEYGNVLDEVARTGNIPARNRSGAVALPLSVRRRLYPERSSVTSVAAFRLWHQLYPTSAETAAAVTGLIAACGWNLSTVLRLRMEHITRVDPQDGTTPPEFRVLLNKPRRGPVSQWGENLRGGDSDQGDEDDSPEGIDERFRIGGDKYSKGRLLNMIIELTNGGRRTLTDAGHPCDHLMVGLTGDLKSSCKTPTGLPFSSWSDADVADAPMRLWRESEGLEWATAQAVRHYFVVHVHPEGHLASTNVAYSLTDATMKKIVQPAIAEVLQSQFVGIRATVVTDDGDIASQLSQTVSGDVLMDAELGLLDTLGASCLDYEHNPETHAPCRVSFLDCFACPNAVVMKRHLPRVVAIYERLEFLRSYTPEAGWNSVYAIYHARVTDVLGRFAMSDVEGAREAVTDEDRELVASLIKKKWSDNE